MRTIVAFADSDKLPKVRQEQVDYTPILFELRLRVHCQRAARATRVCFIHRLRDRRDDPQWHLMKENLEKQLLIFRR